MRPLSPLRLFLTLTLAVPALASPLLPTDGSAENALRASYNFQSLLDSRVAVAVENGVATLTGIVTDADHRNLAVNTAAHQAGVTEVRNHVRIDETRAGISDTSIGVKVQTLLHLQAHVRPEAIEVSVKHGVVTLRGQVLSRVQHDQLTRALRNVIWVRSVHDELTEQETADTSPAAELIDDASISAQAIFALRSDRLTTDLRTTVTTRDGVVLLSGGDGAASQIARAKELIGGLRGVKSVTNRISQY